MTWTEIIQHVTNLTKAGVPTTTESEGVIETAIKMTWQEFVEKRKIPDTLKNRVSLSLTNISTTGKGITMIDTINTVQDIKEVRFQSGTDEWTLADEDGRVPPAPVDGKPRSYRYVGNDPVGGSTLGDRIYVEPYDQINEASDKLLVTYWKYLPYLDSTPHGTAPSQVFVDDTIYATTQWDTELVDRAAAYVYNYYKKADQAQLILSKYKIATPPNQNDVQAAS